MGAERGAYLLSTAEICLLAHLSSGRGNADLEMHIGMYILDAILLPQPRSVIEWCTDQNAARLHEPVNGAASTVSSVTIISHATIARAGGESVPILGGPKLDHFQR